MSLSLSLLAAAVVAACGGGDTDEVSASAAGDQATAEAADVSSTDLKRVVQATTAATSTAWQKVAGEGSSFTVSGSQVVRFGSGSKWTQKTVTGTVQCTNSFFGGDPAKGVGKECDVQVDASATGDNSVWKLVAYENKGFTVSGAQTVRFGSGSSWIQKSVTGSAQCTNAFFGKDPLVGKSKECDVLVTSTSPAPAPAPAPAPPPAPAPAPAPGGTWAKVALENMPFVLPTSMTVRFGAGSSWVQKTISGAGQCTMRAFGSDPAPNSSKECDVLVPFGATAPAPTPLPPAPTLPAGTWQKVASDNGTYNVSGLHIMRYGSSAGWVMMQDSGKGPCTSYYFGRDPAPGTVKECDVFVPTVATVAVAMPGGGPKIDVSKIPPGDPGYGVDLIRAASGPIDGPGDSGDVRTECNYSHMAFDDPIVFPGQPGASHLHMFFGNTGTNAYSTASSIANSGYSTCGGGTSNRTGYWVPAMIDTKDGTPVAPTGTNAGNGVYYKTGYAGDNAYKTKPFPAGLRMVAGDAKNASPNGQSQYSCYTSAGNINLGPSIPNCPANSQLEMDVKFPQCWDGVNLDSPDHKSHMAYYVEASAWGPGGCPSTHPVQLPSIQFRTLFNVKEANTTSRWRLSSDVYDPSLPGGYSAHGDWFNGWNPSVLNTWITKCSVTSMDCHFNLLGDGTELFLP